ncbi:hypothetical protein Sste5346_002620 [Sporothrix stenoceras]|uniref:Uncharacterized protein n=1 Tax=Sporothrix stenoceras TaxID=5173 RepID=A0ABR3ZIS6_9PEZI
MHLALKLVFVSSLARRRRDDMARELQHSRQAVDLLPYPESGGTPGSAAARASSEGEGGASVMLVSRLETAVKTAVADVAGIAAVMNGIRAVLEDLDALLAVIASKQAGQ